MLVLFAITPPQMENKQRGDVRRARSPWLVVSWSVFLFFSLLSRYAFTTLYLLSFLFIGFLSLYLPFVSVFLYFLLLSLPSSVFIFPLRVSTSIPLSLSSSLHWSFLPSFFPLISFFSQRFLSSPLLLVCSFSFSFSSFISFTCSFNVLSFQGLTHPLFLFPSGLSLFNFLAVLFLLLFNKHSCLLLIFSPHHFSSSSFLLPFSSHIFLHFLSFLPSLFFSSRFSPSISSPVCVRDTRSDV